MPIQAIAGDHVQPAQEQVEPVGDVRVEHASVIRAASGRGRSRRARRAPVSSSSLARPARCAPAAPSRISPRGRRLTKTTKRNPWRASYAGVQPGELREHLRVVVRSLLGGGARREARALPDRGMRGQRLDLLARSAAARTSARRARSSGSSTSREPLDEPRAPLEELRELVARSAAAVARARVGRDEQRNVVVPVRRARAAARHGWKNGDGGWKTSGTCPVPARRELRRIRPSPSVSPSADRRRRRGSSSTRTPAAGLPGGGVEHMGRE